VKQSAPPRGGTSGDGVSAAGAPALPDARSPIGFTPALADFAARVRESFARQGVMTLIGAELVDVAPGYCAIALAPRPQISQQHGYVHAGILATLVDSAGGYAGYSLFPEDSSVLTVEYKLNLLAPAQGERIVAEGFVVKPGRTLTITRGEVHAEGAGKRVLVAIMQQTLMVMRGKADRAAEPRHTTPEAG
jgi:uncharacterized protein (TIGR00369 family)